MFVVSRLHELCSYNQLVKSVDWILWAILMRLIDHIQLAEVVSQSIPSKQDSPFHDPVEVPQGLMMSA